MKIRFSFWRGVFVPYAIALAAMTLTALCFAVYRGKGSLLAPISIMLLVGGLTYFQAFVWSLRQARRHAYREQKKLMFAVATAPESKSKGPVFGSFAMNELIVPLTQAEAQRMEQWLKTMPASVADKFDVASRVVALID